MSGFLKNLKGLFIASDEEMLKAEQERTGSSTDRPSPTVKSQSSNPKVSVDNEVLKNEAAGEVNQKFLDILLESVTQNNQEGYDYLEYKQALRSLIKMPMDESTRFQSAFAMAQTMGASKSKLVDSGKAYLAVLKKEEKKFLISVSNQRQSKVDEKKQSLLQIDNWIVEKEAEIKRLMEEIISKKASKENIENALASTSKKIDSVKDNFEASYKYLSNQIQQDIDKINNYLK